jgi:hypothetical protein
MTSSYLNNDEMHAIKMLNFFKSATSRFTIELTERHSLSIISTFIKTFDSSNDWVQSLQKWSRALHPQLKEELNGFDVIQDPSVFPSGHFLKSRKPLSLRDEIPLEERSEVVSGVL